MRHSLCLCEPQRAVAGESNTWTFNYTPSENLPKGTLFRFDLLSDGRDIDWELPETNLKKTNNLIYALFDGKILNFEAVELADRYAPVYQLALPKQLSSGETFSIVLGAKKRDGVLDRTNGSRCQTYTQRRRAFSLQYDPKGKGQFTEEEIFTLDIRGAELHTIRVLTPSFVARNTRFDIVARFEDKFGNLTSRAPEETMIELSYEHLRENLNWKIFVPETGYISLPNLYFNEAGMYTITLNNLENGKSYSSPPILCFDHLPANLFWGTLHGESVRVDSTENIENCIRHFRDDQCDQFFAASPFESEEETSNEIWKLISNNISEFDEAERFTTFLGLQWQGAARKEGNRLFLWSKENKPLIRKKDSRTNTLSKIYKLYSPKELLSIPTFTMGEGFDYDFENYEKEFERVVEIYNAWGSSECTKKEGNPFPIKGTSKKGVQESPEGSIIQALLKNCRFGFVAGGLDDRGIYSDFYENEQEQYSPGMTAIIAKDQSRANLFEALQNRSCYATTGPKMIVGIAVAGIKMGQEISIEQKPGLKVNRHISGYAAGTCPLKMVEIIRNGKVIHKYKPETYHLHFEYDDLEPLEKVVIAPPKKGDPHFVFYYIRVTQQDGNMAWSSPIWVDMKK